MLDLLSTSVRRACSIDFRFIFKEQNKTGVRHLAADMRPSFWPCNVLPSKKEGAAAVPGFRFRLVDQAGRSSGRSRQTICASHHFAKIMIAGNTDYGKLSHF